ncbi:MAG: radical SAM protein [Bacteroidia bacterium]|nr:radical SAM protein [Bacteroidia bacterium]
MKQLPLTHQIDVFRNYDLSRLDPSNPYFETKSTNFQAAKAAYASGMDHLSHYPLRATLQTTERCNLKCPMCQIHGSPITRTLQAMSHSTIHEIVRQLFPHLIEFHPSNIGEPMVHRWFDDLCRQAKTYGVMMDLTTNGTLLNQERIDLILPILLDIKFSWDGAKPETFEAIRKGADYRQVLANLDLILKMRNDVNPKATITLQMTVMRSNFQELLDLIQFAAARGIDRVKAYHIFSHRPEMDAESMAVDQELFEPIRQSALAFADECGIALEISEPLMSEGTPPDLIQQACRLLWTECWIDVDGSIFPCHSHQNLSYGKIQHEPFLQSWNAAPFLSLRQAQICGSPRGICKGCGMNYLKKDENQPVPIDRNNYLSGPKQDVDMRWSSRSKQFEIPR